MFFKKKEIPTIPTYVNNQLQVEGILSDEELFDEYHRRYCKNWTGSCIAKRGETMRKELYEMKRKGILIETSRKIRKNNSHEIFYKLAE